MVVQMEQHHGWCRPQLWWPELEWQPWYEGGTRGPSSLRYQTAGMQSKQQTSDFLNDISANDHGQDKSFTQYSGILTENANVLRQNGVH